MKKIINALTRSIQAFCMSYPSVSHYFTQQTEIYRELVSALRNAFQSRYINRTFHAQFTHSFDIMAMVKVNILKQMISNKFKSKQWKILILKQKILLDLMPAIIDELQKYFVFRKTGDKPNDKAILMIFKTWKYVFIFMTLLINKMHRYMTDKEKEVFVSDPNANPLRVDHNADM